MLEGLESVPWERLHVFDGRATDLPDSLRRLASPDPVISGDAFEYLLDALYHQGGIPNASARAAPFLLEIAEQASSEKAIDILVFLAHMVAAYSGDFGVVAALEDNPVRQVLKSNLDPLDRLLEHPNVRVRLAAFMLAAAMGPNGDVAADRAEEMFRSESDARIRAVLAVVLLLLGTGREEEDLVSPIRALLREDGYESKEVDEILELLRHHQAQDYFEAISYLTDIVGPLWN